MIRFLTYITLSLVLFVSPGSDEAREANEAYHNGEYARAEELYKSAIEATPDNTKLYFNLGNAQARQGKIEEAIESYMEYRGLAVTPDEKALAEYNIGRVLAENRKWKPAALHFKKSLRLNPQDMEAKHNYEQAMARLKDENEQQDQQQQQNQPPPEPSEYAKAMKKRAEQLVDQRKYSEAHTLMKEALAADETVRAFNSFIERIKNVSEINTYQ